MDITHLPDVIQEHRVQQQVHKTLIGLSWRVASRVSSRKLIFISVQEFMRDVNEWSLELPKNFDVVCAIPRTGLLAGALLSQRWNVPLSTPEFLKNNLSWGVSGVSESTETLTKGSFKRVLLVDDSVGSGETIVKAERIIRGGLAGDIDIVKAAVITSYQGKRKVDYFKRVIHGADGVFEWSLPSRYKNWSIATDLDGVICEDPSTEVLNNKTKYEQWLKQVKPLFVPLYPFTAIVSGRLEKYRGETTNWLRNHGVKFKSLYLAKSESDALHKARVLKTLKPRFYIESDRTLAEDIWKLTGIPTLCYKTMTMFS